LLDIIDWGHQEDGKPIVPLINFYTIEKALELASKLDIKEIKVMFFYLRKVVPLNIGSNHIARDQMRYKVWCMINIHTSFNILHMLMFLLYDLAINC